MTKFLVSRHKIGLSRLKECHDIYFYVMTFIFMSRQMMFYHARQAIILQCCDI